MPLPNPDHTADDDDDDHHSDSDSDRESPAAESEHFLEESAGLFGKTIYHCRHCETRSPDRAYFAEICCPPTIDSTTDPDSDDPHMQK